jgi:murein DD-endopeptidase MepM/ murein hydrolase activator NlpD
MTSLLKSIAFLFSITCSLNLVAGEPLRGFTDMEVNHVRVKTPDVFAGNNSLTLHLEDLQKEEYCFPLPGGKVISAYGTRGGHTGTDIKTCANDTIRCTFDGIVRMAKKYGGYGNVIVVRHKNGLESLYSHNSKNFVKSGDEVKAGQAIALTGRTGSATTEHLHFEFRINGCHFNPSIIFDMNNHTLKKAPLVCSHKGSGISVKPIKENES